MSTGVEQDAILLDAEKDLTNQFNTVLGATIAVCIVFLFVSIYFENLLTPIVEEEENSTTDYTPLWNRYKDNYQTNLENGTILEKAHILYWKRQMNGTLHTYSSNTSCQQQRVALVLQTTQNFLATGYLMCRWSKSPRYCRDRPLFSRAKCPNANN